MNSNHDLLKNFLKHSRSQVEYLGLRWVSEKTSMLNVRNEKPENTSIDYDEGVMVEVFCDGHFGYSGTSDFSEEGLKKAFEIAREQTQKAAKIHNLSKDLRSGLTGTYISPRKRPLREISLAQISDILINASARLKVSDKVVSRRAMAMNVETEIYSINSLGGETLQNFDMVMLDAAATAEHNKEFQRRSLNGSLARSYQMGSEAFAEANLLHDCERVAEEAVLLAEAPNCPTGTMDVIIAPDQMMLQIHESIGHPLELDRILGDERNYAGFSFVQLQDIGSLQYGSNLMNVSFDPTLSGELAAYAFDDAGTPARKEYLIKEGVLVRSLGSTESQARAQKPGVANFRSASWNRAPIDRMANINLEPGTSSFEDLVKSVKNGILLRSNRSWSIDDYRNKFQFSCEWGQLIEDGQLKGLVKNPSYRGTTLNFWRNLAGVGNQSEFFGTPFCGKGEPSQVIRVGHASPYCLFKNIEVFGG